MGIKDFIARKVFKNIFCYGNYQKHISKKAVLRIGQRLYFNVYPYSRCQKADFGNLLLGDNSLLEIKDKASFRSGCRLLVFNDAKAVFGSNLFVNSNTSIFVRDSLTIGDNTVISQNVVIRDSDVHSIGGWAY